jgi:hypothetical protein
MERINKHPTPDLVNLFCLKSNHLKISAECNETVTYPFTPAMAFLNASADRSITASSTQNASLK